MPVLDEQERTAFFVRTSLSRSELRKSLHLCPIHPSAIAPTPQCKQTPRKAQTSRHITFAPDPVKDTKATKRKSYSTRLTAVREPRTTVSRSQQLEEAPAFPLVLDGGFSVQVSRQNLEQHATDADSVSKKNTKRSLRICMSKIREAVGCAKRVLHRGWDKTKAKYHLAKTSSVRINGGVECHRQPDRINLRAVNVRTPLISQATHLSSQRHSQYIQIDGQGDSWAGQDV